LFFGKRFINSFMVLSRGGVFANKAQRVEQIPTGQLATALIQYRVAQVSRLRLL